MLKKIKKLIFEIKDYLEERRVKKIQEQIRKEDPFIYK